MNITHKRETHPVKEFAAVTVLWFGFGSWLWVVYEIGQALR